jgi:hypothetical protein
VLTVVGGRFQNSLGWAVLRADPGASPEGILHAGSFITPSHPNGILAHVHLAVKLRLNHQLNSPTDFSRTTCKIDPMGWPAGLTIRV